MNCFRKIFRKNISTFFKLQMLLLKKRNIFNFAKIKKTYHLTNIYQSQFEPIKFAIEGLYCPLDLYWEKAYSASRL